MLAQESYKYNPYNFDSLGLKFVDRSFFTETLKEWEEDFHKKNPLYYANHLFANITTMLLIDKCIDASENERCGIDLIDGNIDIDINMEMDKSSSIQRVYALGSYHDDDEPIFLIIDEKLSDGTLMLCYIPDDEEEEDDVINMPINSDFEYSKK